MKNTKISNRVNKKLIIMSIFLLLASISLAGCKKTVNEELVENSMENTLGEGAEVEVDDKNVTIETDQGIMKTGENLELPKDWPEDVYVAEGEIIASSNMNGSNNLTITSSKTAAELREEYDEKLKENGWSETSSFSMGDAIMIGAEKDDRNLSLSITVEDGQTTVVLIVNSF